MSAAETDRARDLIKRFWDLPMSKRRAVLEACGQVPDAYLGDAAERDALMQIGAAGRKADLIAAVERQEADQAPQVVVETICREGPAPQRSRPPNRRQTWTFDLEHGDSTTPDAWRSIQISVGVDLSDWSAPKICEVFASGAKTGSDLDATLGDACILVSILLQTGYSPEQLSRNLSRIPLGPKPEDGTAPASVISALVDLLADAWRDRDLHSAKGSDDLG